MNKNQFALSIDHTLLKPDSTLIQIQNLCSEALSYGFASVCVLPYYVHAAYELLDGHTPVVCTVVGFPLGAGYGMVKAREASEAIARGATEIDMVMNIAAMKSGDYDTVLYDIEEVVESSHSRGALVKVIIETCLLSDDEKRRACDLVNQAGADFIKTSTGFSSGGATVADIALMKATVSPRVRIKASGGIRTAAFAKELIAAGASRIGTSASVSMMKEISELE